MLKSLRIKNFRTFRDITLPTLGNVNLVVGKNNTGKTMLLEALRLYAAKGWFPTMRELLVERDEYERGARADLHDNDARLDIEALFCGRRPTRDEAISIGPKRGQALTIRLVLVHDDSKDSRQATLWQAVEESGPNGTPDLIEGLDIKFGEDSIYVGPIAPLKNEALYGRRYMRSVPPGAVPPPFVPAVGLRSAAVAAWWDAVSLTDAEERVVECLQIVAPAVSRISLVNHPRDHSRERSPRIPMLRMDGHADPIPLKSLGDGMARMFQIALAMEDAREHGLLLIDEIENGIHYTVLPRLWNFVFQAAKRNNVQVFATSHSWDCVEAFQRAGADREDSEAVLIRLEKKNGDVKPIVFSESELAIAARDEIEVR